MNASDRAAPPWQGRYVTLDGMRGIAALGVALFHYNISQAPHGYVAVDFFFALSGFVLCRTYLPRWRAGLTSVQFMKQRLVRLYPLFLAGIVITTLSAVSNRWTGRGDIFSYEKIASSLPFNALMLPSPFTHTLFPLNVPAWSLFFELVASLALVLVLFRLPRKGQVAVAAASACIFVPAVLANGGGNIGPLWSQLGISLVRTAMSFTGGVLLAQLPAKDIRHPGWLGVFCLFAIVTMLVANPQAIPKAWYDLACSLFVAPALVWLGSRGEPSRVLVPVAWFLGEVSYAVYAVHWGLMEPLRWFKDDLGWNPALMGALYLSACVGLGWLCVRYIDIPLRRRLNILLHARARHVPPRSVPN
ncbi:acyltransferase family protein [Novosphingobium panipatense]|uniref:acyltransferase family protein n=1 Tax=Novosphingobium TaxID=165696 RepID=UPI000CDA65D1|nr:acyltransferase [Novosphingobium sp. HII-3]